MLKNRKFLSFLLILSICLSLLPSATIVLAADDPAEDPIPVYMDKSGKYSFEERAADLVSRMTTSEKASQTVGSMAPAIPRLGVSGYQYWNEALHGFAATVHNSTGTVGTAPSYGTSLPNHMSYPQSTSMGASWDPKLYYQEATQISDDIREYVVDNNKNLNMYSPNVNLQRDPRWGRNEEAYSEDPYLTGVMGSAFVNGMEGKDYVTGKELDPNGYKKVSTTVKHYTANNSENNRAAPLNGGLANGGVEGGAYNVDYRAMREYFTMPYRNIIQNADVGSVMTAYSTVNAQPVSLSSYFMDTLLRQTFGFSGFITSDCDSVSTIANQNYTNPHTGKLITLPEQFANALAHGEDLECSAGMSSSGAGNYWLHYNSMISNIKTDKGVFTENDFDIAVHRMMTIRMRLGEFDGDTAYKTEAASRRAAGENGAYVNGRPGQTRERIDLAEVLSENSVVMLKNAVPAGKSEKILPLKAAPTAEQPFKVAIIGQWARTGTYLGQYSTTYNVFDETSNYITIENGIIDALKKQYGDNVQFTYYRGFTNTQTALASLSTINEEEVAAAGAADLAIVVAATEQATSREGNDRLTIKLPGAQAQLASAVGKANPNTIVILETCGPVQVTSFEPDVDAILWSSFGGIRKGVGYGRILTGVVNPSGKTQQTWFNNVDNADPLSDLTSIYDYDLYESEDHPGRTYMHYSKTYEPGGVSYPFGYGLSYTTYDYSNITLSAASVTADDTVTIAFDVKNTGTTAGKEIAQLYVAQPGTTLPNRPIKRLVGFDKVELAAGETKTITLSVKIKDIAYFDTATRRYVVDTGAWQFQVGAACNNILLTKDFVVTNGQITEKPQVVTFKPNQAGDDVIGIGNRLIFKKGAQIDPRTAVAMNNEALYGYIIDNNVPGFMDLSKAGISKIAEIPGTVTYSSNRPEVVAVEDGKIVTKGAGVATVKAVVDYNGVQAEGEFVVVVLSDPGPSSILVDGKPIDDYNSEIRNYSFELEDSVSAVPTVSVVPSSDPSSSYVINQAKGIPGVAEVVCTDSIAGTVVVYRIGFAHRAKSTDFTQVSTLPGIWSAPDDAGKFALSADGLKLTAQKGAFGTETLPKNVIKQAIAGDWVARTNLTLSAAISQNNQQAGIVIYDDDQNYIRYVYERPDTGTSNVLRIYIAANGNEVRAYTVNLSATNLYLQIQKIGTLYSFSYSTNGTTWTRIATTTPPVVARYALPQISLWCNTGNTGADAFDATFKYLNVYTLAEASPTLKTLTINGEPVNGFVPDSNAVIDFTYPAANFAAIPVIGATAVSGYAVEVEQANELPGAAVVTVSSALASTKYYVVFDEAPVSDSFIAGAFDSKWRILKPSDPAVWSIDPGKGLRLPTQRYDMTTANTGWQDLFTRPAGGDWEILAKVHYPAAPRAATQTLGLYVVQDDNNFVKIDTRYNAASPRAYVTREINGAQTTSYVALPASAVAEDGSLTVYYIVSKQSDDYTFKYALNPNDYSNFATVGSAEVHLINPRIGLLAATNSGTAAVIQTYCEYIAYKPLDGFTTWGDGTLKTYLDTAFDNAVAVLENSLPLSTKLDLDFPIPGDYSLEVISSDPAVIDAEGHVTLADTAKTVVLTLTVADNFGRSRKIEKSIVVEEKGPSLSVELLTQSKVLAQLTANIQVKVTPAGFVPEEPVKVEIKGLDGVVYGTAYANNGVALVKTSAFPAAGEYSIVASSADYTGSAALNVAPYDLGIWNAVASVENNGLSTIITFGENVVPRFGTFDGCVTINGSAPMAGTSYTGNVIWIPYDYAVLKPGDKIVIQNVMFPNLFPSFCFTFTVTV